MYQALPDLSVESMGTRLRLSLICIPCMRHSMRVLIPCSNFSRPSHKRCAVHFRGAIILLPLTDQNRLLHPAPPRATREEPLPGHPNLANPKRDFRRYANLYVLLSSICVHDSIGIKFQLHCHIYIVSCPDPTPLTRKGSGVTSLNPWACRSVLSCPDPTPHERRGLVTIRQLDPVM